MVPAITYNWSSGRGTYSSTLCSTSHSRFYYPLGSISWSNLFASNQKALTYRQKVDMVDEQSRESRSAQ